MMQVELFHPAGLAADEDDIHAGMIAEKANTKQGFPHIIHKYF
jgi:hypothetical protein